MAFAHFLPVYPGLSRKQPAARLGILTVHLHWRLWTCATDIGQDTWATWVLEVLSIAQDMVFTLSGGVLSPRGTPDHPHDRFAIETYGFGDPPFSESLYL